jgi:Protein of unknown function (DUF3800)
MHFCYLDESGSTEAPDDGQSATPVMVILGLIVDADHVPELTRDFLALKRRHFPGLFARGPSLDHVLTEIKGSFILRMTRKDSRDRRRQARQVRLDLLDLLEAYDCRIVGRVWVKAPHETLKPASTYCYAVQDIARHFGHYLLTAKSEGVMIADSRSQNLNINTAHSIFTQKLRAGGDPYPLLHEVPVFAHSDNHAGLQIADLVASTLVFPMAVAAFGAEPGSVHASPRYLQLRDEFAGRVRELEYFYRDENGRRRGGLVVSYPSGGRPGMLIRNGECVRQQLIGV